MHHLLYKTNACKNTCNNSAQDSNMTRLMHATMESRPHILHKHACNNSAQDSNMTTLMHATMESRPHILHKHACKNTCNTKSETFKCDKTNACRLGNILHTYTIMAVANGGGDNID